MTRFSVAAVVAAGALALGVLALRGPLSGVERPGRRLPAPSTVGAAPADSGLQVVVFSGGCFWGVQAVFEHVKGVVNATAGYAGGDTSQATYEIVSTGTTGNAESVRVTFDPDRVTFDKLLQVFFSVAHDPTERNRQGPDLGTQYRSAVWYATDQQGRETRAYIAQLTTAKAFSRPIVTEVRPLRSFKRAETYHQDYLIHHPHQPYIVINDIPKLHHLEQRFPALWRPQPVTWNATTAMTEN